YDGFRKLYLAGQKRTQSIDLFKAIVFKEGIWDQRSYGRYVDGMDKDTRHLGDIYWRANMIVRRQQAAASFIAAIVLKNPTNNYLFLDQDRLVLFNFDQDQIETFSLTGQPLGTQEILFNRKNLGGQHSDPLIIQDPISRMFYCVLTKKRGYELGEVNIKTGAIGKKYKLGLASFRQIAVLGGQSFALGVPLRQRSTEDQQFLQRQLLALNE
ncbi:MAG: hypothetical protein AAF840_01380, partial [Bacteroidota bacterium]